MSTSTEYMDGLNAPAERRFYPRVTPPTPIYVAFGASNLGVLCNVSENGFQVSTPDELLLNSVFRVSLALNGTPKTIVVTVRTVWTNDAQKRSGIQLLDLSDEDRQQIRKWIVFEMTRNENPNAWRMPKNGERPSLTRKPMDANPADRPAVPGQQDVGAVPQQDVGAVPQPQRSETSTPYNAAAFVLTPAPAASEVSESIPPSATEQPSSAQNVEQTPVAPAPVPAFFSESAHAARVSSSPDSAPADTQPSATDEADLPKIANPFDEPDPNAQFTSPFPKVPLPIHGEFDYAAPPPKIHSRKSWSAQLRTRPLIIWAAALALLCFGANALVRYKIKRNAQRFASESASTTAAKQSDSAPASSDNPDVNSTSQPVADTQSASNSIPDGASQEQPSSSPTAPATVAQNDRQSVAIPKPARSAANQPDSVQPAPRSQSSLDAGDNRAYAATAPPSSDPSAQTARSSQSVTTPRTWSAPAPNPSSSTASTSSDAPQSPSAMSSSNNISAQSAPAPVVAQSRPTPPPALVQTPSSNNSTNSVSASNSNAPANTANAARTQNQTPPPANSQSSSYAANSNPAPSRPQSPIYNANAQAQRSAIIGSINSVHSSGIFDSNDTTTASSSAPPPAASRGNANAANTNVASRAVSNAPVVSADVPQDRDIEIPAPKGFNSSWVDLPGEHVVRSPAGTVHIHRLVRVPGERVPGQRWLWRGKFNVALGDVINRVDPSAVQASGASGGSLTVMASIDKDGYVTDLKPLYGNFALLPSVSRTVRNWHYEPTYLDSKRAETQAQIEFDLRPTTAASSPNRNTHP